MKKLLLLIILTLVSINHSWAQSVEITESAGWLESAYVKWNPVTDAKWYNVYIKASGALDSEYKQIDDMLVRKYADYFRADVVGLKAGNYIMKVVPVFEDAEDASKQAVSTTLIAQAHVREGFAFSPNSKMGTASGAYNNDGTLRSDAKVIYLTAATAKTVKLDVIIDSKGKVQSCEGLGAILAARQKGYDKTPLAIRVVGTVTASDMVDQINSTGYIEVKGNKGFSELNVTIEGIGNDATLYGWGILVRNGMNVEIRNLGAMAFPDDGFSLDTDNENVWVHHNDFFYGKNGGGGKDKGDGSLDSKESGFVTISYNHFWDSGKCNLLGNGTETPTYLTYHHNWYDHSDSRHPRVRCHTVHVYNNYYDGNAKYGVGATMASNVFVENNYYRNCKYPMLISQQGSDVATDPKGTFSGENGGMIKAFGNHIEGATRFVDQTFSSTAFDAIVVSSREEVVPATYVTLKGGTTYNNFDTNSSIMYPYTAHSADDAKANVMQYAGRINGGDLRFTFTAADDKDSELNPAIASAISSYKGTVISIGTGGGTVEPPVEPPVDPPLPPEGDQVHNFTLDAKNSAFFTISGTLSDTKGTVVYEGLTLTQCLKMETSTSVSFTAAYEAELILVFNQDFVKKVVIDGTSYNPVAGVLKVMLPAGSHVITKGDTSNLYYMSLQYTNTSGIEKSENLNLKLYPNPVLDNLIIASEDNIEFVEIYSLSGILKYKGIGDIESVDMSGFNSGSYIVKIQTSEGNYKQIILKK